MEKFSHSLTGETMRGAVSCHILESFPKNKDDSQYGLIQSFINKTDFMPLQVNFFDTSGKRLKTYRVLEVKTIQGIPTETQVVMEDLRRNTRPC